LEFKSIFNYNLKAKNIDDNIHRCRLNLPKIKGTWRQKTQGCWQTENSGSTGGKEVDGGHE
jgi:hypothetical protein